MIERVAISETMTTIEGDTTDLQIAVENDIGRDHAHHHHLHDEKEIALLLVAALRHRTKIRDAMVMMAMIEGGEMMISVVTITTAAAAAAATITTTDEETRTKHHHEIIEIGEITNNGTTKESISLYMCIFLHLTKPPDESDEWTTMSDNE